MEDVFRPPRKTPITVEKAATILRRGKIYFLIFNLFLPVVILAFALPSRWEVDIFSGRLAEVIAGINWQIVWPVWAGCLFAQQYVWAQTTWALANLISANKT